MLDLQQGSFDTTGQAPAKNGKTVTDVETTDGAQRRRAGHRVGQRGK